MDIERKSFTGLQLKADKPGAFTAKFATLNVVDKDGDVTIPGAVPVGKSILISAYQHGSWSGGLPVGKGIIREDGNDVMVEGEFNLNSQTGRDHYETIKFAPDLQEFSYGFTVQQSEQNADWNGQKVNRILKRLDVFEVSPVLRGAGVGTGVLAIKTEGQTLEDQTKAALAAVDGLMVRIKALAVLRKNEGKKKAMSDQTRERMGQMMTRLQSLMDDMEAMMDEDPQKSAMNAPNKERMAQMMTQMARMMADMQTMMDEMDEDPQKSAAADGLKVWAEFLKNESKLLGVK